MNASRSKPGNLSKDHRGVALIEFALCLPILIILTLWAFEMINYVIVREQISQLALQVADNASRIGTQNSIQTQIDEKQINDLFTGANLQAGSLNVAGRGRIILSSLEVDPDKPNGQYIHWQRCYGAMGYSSSYGIQGDGKGTTSFTGMGPSTGRVQAMTSVPAMFVEIGYQYQPIVSSRFAPGSVIQEIATMLVRDNRDTSDPGVNPVAGVTASTCK